jgi:type IV secretion system protein TrbL
VIVYGTPPRLSRASACRKGARRRRLARVLTAPKGFGRVFGVLFVLTLLALVVAAGAALAQTGTDVAGDFTEEFRLAASGWTDSLRPLAQRTFALLAGIEFAVSAAAWGLRRGSADDVLGQLFLKVALVSFLFMCLTFFDEWIPAIVNSFVRAGQEAAGVTELNPTGVLELGLDLYASMVEGSMDLGMLLSPAESFAVVWSGLGVMMAFAVVAAQLVVLLIESYIAVTAGVFFLGFASFRGTASFADRYLVWAVGVGVRLFLVYLVVGIGIGVTEQWTAMLDGMGEFDFFTAFRIVGGSLVFAIVAVVIPNRTAGYLLSGASFGLSEAVRMR